MNEQFMKQNRSQISFVVLLTLTIFSSAELFGGKRKLCSISYTKKEDLVQAKEDPVQALEKANPVSDIERSLIKKYVMSYNLPEEDYEYYIKKIVAVTASTKNMPLDLIFAVCEAELEKDSHIFLVDPNNHFKLSKMLLTDSIKPRSLNLIERIQFNGCDLMKFDKFCNKLPVSVTALDLDHNDLRKLGVAGLERLFESFPKSLTLLY